VPARIGTATLSRHETPGRPDGQYGFRSSSLPRKTRSLLPEATISSACSGSVKNPPAITGRPVTLLTISQRGSGTPGYAFTGRV
jgi:hypothetical protein